MKTPFYLFMNTILKGDEGYTHNELLEMTTVSEKNKMLYVSSSKLFLLRRG